MAFFDLLFALLSLLLIPGLFFGTGLLIAFTGFWALRKEFSISRHGLVVPGTVIAINTRREGRRRKATVYDAVVRFQLLESADLVTFVVSTGSFGVYQVDQPVRVIYLPADLKSARIDDRMRWVGPYMVISFGLLLAALTVLLSLSLITVHVDARSRETPRGGATPQTYSNLPKMAHPWKPSQMSVDSLGLYLQEQNRVFLAGFKLKGP